MMCLLARVRAKPTGRLLVRGSNGSGKSSLLVALKARLASQAYYWPTSDKLAFAFSGAANDDDVEPAASGFSSGERQLKSLQEIVNRTHAAVYLLDEWDANLDAKTAPAPRFWLLHLQPVQSLLKYRIVTGCNLQTLKDNMANIFNTDLPKNPANYAVHSPLAFIERTAEVYPDKLAVVHGKLAPHLA